VIIITIAAVIGCRCSLCGSLPAVTALADEARADQRGRSRMSLNYILYLIGALVVLAIVLKFLGLY